MRIYVGTYAKYNDGNLFGDWLEVGDYTDKAEFIEACCELHADEQDPELMFQDWEDIPESLISECYVAEELWEVLEAINELCDGDAEPIKAYLSLFMSWDRDDFQDRYRGWFAGWQEFVEQLLEKNGELTQIPENLRFYFDYEKYANDLRISGDFAEEEGHFFWNL